MKKLTAYLSFFFLSFPLFYIDGENGVHPQQLIYSPEEIKNELAQIRNLEIQAPEFPEGVDWLNTNETLSLSKLRGKVVLLNFWSFNCSSCVYLNKNLHNLENKFRDRDLMIIDVISVKFLNEINKPNIQHAVEQFNITHPVIIDKENMLCKFYNVYAYPTLVLIDPEGNFSGYISEIGNQKIIESYTGILLDEFNI